MLLLFALFLQNTMQKPKRIEMKQEWKKAKQNKAKRKEKQRPTDRPNNSDHIASSTPQMNVYR